MKNQAARQDGGGEVQTCGIASWETSDPKFTTPSHIINLHTRRAAWLRLVRATRDPLTWELLRAHRRRWREYRRAA